MPVCHNSVPRETQEDQAGDVMFPYLLERHVFQVGSLLFPSVLPKEVIPGQCSYGVLHHVPQETHCLLHDLWSPLWMIDDLGVYLFRRDAIFERHGVLSRLAMRSSFTALNSSSVLKECIMLSLNLMDSKMYLVTSCLAAGTSGSRSPARRPLANPQSPGISS